jgi:zinc protease
MRTGIRIATGASGVDAGICSLKGPGRRPARGPQAWALALALLGPAACGPLAHAASHAAAAPAAPATPAKTAPAAKAQPAAPVPVRSVEGIVEHRLANGLQVLLAPDDSKPTTTVNVTYRVGSRHENYGETGMAHLLEHLVFKGSKKYPDGWAQFSRRGMRFNGSTWFDRTNYFASFSHNEDNLKWYLGWQADAMVNAFIAKKDLDSEMTVVRNEMEIGENNPSRILFEKTLATMYQWHNYGKSTIGARTDVEGVDIERLRAFYRRHYQPDNATLVVSGKFDVNRTLAMITEAFGPVPKPKRELPRLYTLDPVQDGERSITLRRVGGVPLLFSAYHVPPGAHPDTASVELMAALMTDAPAGRLHKALVETKKAAAVFAFSVPLHDPGFAIFGAQLAANQDPESARAALLQTLEGVAANPFTAQEVDRARAKWLNDWEQRFTDPEKVGIALSEFVALGDWRLYFLLRDRVKAATTEQVNRGAMTHLLQANRTFAQYVPTPKPERAPAPVSVDLAAQLKDYKPVEKLASVESFEATPANIEARTRRLAIEPGLKVALLPKPTRGDAAVAQLVLRTGNLEALKGRHDSATMLARLFDKGTQKRSRQELQDRLTALKAELSVSGSATALNVTVKTTREHLPAVVELIGEMLRTPAIDAASLEEVRAQALSGLQAQRDEPAAIVSNTLSRHGNPYAADDPRYAPTFAEIEQRLRAMTLEQVRDFHARFHGASNAQFSAVGSFDESAVRAAAQRAFGSWASATAVQRVPTPLVALPPARLVTRTPDKQNAVMGMRLPLAVKELDADHVPLLLANFIVGGSPSSRLWVRVREKEGLSYGLGTQISFNPHEASSMFTGQAAFAPSNRARVEAAIREELERSLKDGFTEAEVTQAKQGLLSFRRLSRAQDDSLAGSLVSNEWLGRNFQSAQALDEAIAKVTSQQAFEAWRRHIDLSRLVWVLAGDFKEP